MGSLPFSLIQKRKFQTKMETSLKLMLFSMCFSTLGAQVNKTEKSGHGYHLSGCPPPYYHYPHEENGYPTCAYYWNEEGDDWPVDACNGIRASAGVGDFNPTGTYFPMGSFYVQPGCTMYLYEDSNFGGTREELYEGLVPNNQHSLSLTLKLHQFLIDFGGYSSNILLLLKPQVKQPLMIGVQKLQLIFQPQLPWRLKLLFNQEKQFKFCKLLENVETVR